MKGAANVAAHIKMIVSDQFCPAKKTFIALAGATEYASRAKVHCKDAPPTGNGVGGAAVALTNECNAAFATNCP